MRKIIHVDMDCFYAAVEEKYHPELKGLPVGIGGPANTRSVLCTANYAARAYGVRAAMPSSRALRLCPGLILRPPRFDLYRLESLKVRDIFERFSNQIEPLSLDEAYLDVSDCSLFQGSATLIAKEIRRLIKSELSLTASAGVAPNKFLAKIASDWKKPDGLFVIRPEEIKNFIRPLPVENIFGVGKVTAQRLHALNIKTCEDIQNLSEFELYRYFGSRAADMRLLSQGIDNRPVVTHWERKSLSVEETFSLDIFALDKAIKEIPELHKEWLRRFEKLQEKNCIRGWSVKIKYTDFTQATIDQSSREIPSAKDFATLLEKIWQRRGDPIRLLGVGVKLGVLESRRQALDSELPLFSVAAAH